MSDSNDLTPREMEVLGLAWQCMVSEPKIDNKKLAQLTGYTEKSAVVTLGKIKRKLKNKASGSTGVVNTPKKGATPRVARTPKSSKRGATEDATDDTPTKKGKTTSKLTNNGHDDDEDDEFSMFLVKKEEVSDINGGADAFFKEATAYARST